jgi:outer membrane protein
VNRAAGYPSLSFGANTGTTYYYLGNTLNSPFNSQLKNNWNSSLGFTLSIPIFNKFEVNNSVKQAQITVETYKVDLAMAKSDLKKSIQQAYYNAVAAKARWEAAQTSEKASVEAYRFANQKYESGRASLYDLYQAKSDLTQVLGEKAQAKFEYIFRMKILELLK